jgi:hypothetical protein
MAMSEEPLQSREPLSPDDFFDAYYKESGLDRVLVIELLAHVAHELELPVEKLRPTDRFSIELALGKGNAWDSGCGILLYELSSLAKRRKLSAKMKVDSVDEYLRAMSLVY